MGVDFFLGVRKGESTYIEKALPLRRSRSGVIAAAGRFFRGEGLGDFRAGFLEGDLGRGKSRSRLAVGIRLR